MIVLRKLLRAMQVIVQLQKQTILRAIQMVQRSALFTINSWLQVDLHQHRQAAIAIGTSTPFTTSTTVLSIGTINITKAKVSGSGHSTSQLGSGTLLNL